MDIQRKVMDVWRQRAAMGGGYGGDGRSDWLGFIRLYQQVAAEKGHMLSYKQAMQLAGHPWRLIKAQCVDPTSRLIGSKKGCVPENDAQIRYLAEQMEGSREFGREMYDVLDAYLANRSAGAPAAISPDERKMAAKASASKRAEHKRATQNCEDFKRAYSRVLCEIRKENPLINLAAARAIYRARTGKSLKTLSPVQKERARESAAERRAQLKVDKRSRGMLCVQPAEGKSRYHYALCEFRERSENRGMPYREAVEAFKPLWQEIKAVEKPARKSRSKKPAFTAEDVYEMAGMGVSAGRRRAAPRKSSGRLMY